jgi:Putative adhesin
MVLVRATGAEPRHPAQFLRCVALALAAGASLAASGCAPEPVLGSFERTLEVAGPVDLTVRTIAGAIAVRAGDSTSVRVTGRMAVAIGWIPGDAAAHEQLRRLESDPPIEQNGNTIVIGELRVDAPQKWTVAIAYELVVPAGTRVHVSTGAGSVHAHGIGGGSAVETGSGDIEITQAAPGDVDVRTGAGDIWLDGVCGRLSARARAGNIRAAGSPDGPWRLHSSAGNVSVHLPADAGFELHAIASVGSVQTAHPLLVRAVDGQELRGKARGGGPLVSLTTSAGDIRVE